MADVRLTEEARADLQDIRISGVARHGEVAAERHLQAIRQKLELLAAHPLAGQRRTEFRGDLRAIACRPHRILYSVEGDLVVIVRVIHQARDVATALESDH